MPNALNYSTASIRVCIDSADKRLVNGRILSRQLPQPLVFNDLNSLLLQIERVFDYQRFPVAFQRKRSFNAPKQTPAIRRDVDAGTLDAETVLNARGAVATFVIYAISRQNTSWQGEIDLLDGNPRQPFSSDLEFIRLTDSILFPT